MKLRRNFLPRTFTDWIASLFLGICAPLTFWFEMFIVIPEFHPPGSLLYIFTLLLATFLLYNVTTNWLATMLVDTSIKGEILNPPVSTSEALEKSWRLCSICETLAPPRSWHCSSCKICILKRDHHCMFAGYCVGHRNQRYFLLLLFYLCFSSVYASVYNTIFIWFNHRAQYISYSSIIQLLFPLATPFFISVGKYHCYLALYELNLLCTVLSGGLLYYHLSNAIEGKIVYERKSISKYNYGWKENLKIIFGERWHLTWISPFVQSEQNHDGIYWEKVFKETSKTK